MINLYSELNHRIFFFVLVGWLLGWYAKGAFYFTYLFWTIDQIPIVNSFFPTVFQWSWVAKTAYMAPAFSLILLVDARWLRFIPAIQILSSLVLLCHQDTCNDATFVTSFWVALWLWWWAQRIDRSDVALYDQAKKIAVWMLSMIFMGGFAGNLVPKYFSGEIFYNIFVLQDPSSFWSNITYSLPLDKVKFLMGTISKTVIVVEGLLAVSFLFPFRTMSVAASFILAALSLFFSWGIFSVSACLIALLLTLRWADGQRLWEAEKKGIKN